MTNADYYRGLAEDCFFAARQSFVKDVRDACMKDAAHFHAMAERIERRSKTDKSEQSSKASKASIDLRRGGDSRYQTPSSAIRSIAALSLSTQPASKPPIYPRIEDDHGAPDGWTGNVKMARVVWSGPNLSALSMASSSESRLRARWTRLLIVPTAVSQIAAASS